MEPTWTREPNIKVIESLARQYLNIRAADHCDVKFHAKGGFNMLYRIITFGKKSDYSLRVTLPVDPYFKTSSEVATMDYVRSFTKIRVPNVVPYDSSNKNA